MCFKRVLKLDEEKKKLLCPMCVDGQGKVEGYVGVLKCCGGRWRGVGGGGRARVLAW